MTQDEAVALAEKRERTKSKHMTHKRWAAVHDSVKGWHVALVDDLRAVADEARFRAFAAARRGDLQGFVDAASDHLMAKVKEELSLLPPLAQQDER